MVCVCAVWLCVCVCVCVCVCLWVCVRGAPSLLIPVSLFHPSSVHTLAFSRMLAKYRCFIFHCRCPPSRPLSALGGCLGNTYTSPSLSHTHAHTRAMCAHSQVSSLTLLEYFGRVLWQRSDPKVAANLIRTALSYGRILLQVWLCVCARVFALRSLPTWLCMRVST